MARLALSKSSLSREKGQLSLFRRFLPSLDLKRRQLIAERAKAAAELIEARQAIAENQALIGAEVPMLANAEVDLTGLVRLTGVVLGEENLLGTRLPLLESIEIEVLPYGTMVRPHWVDRVVELLHRMLELHTLADVAEQRLALLDVAVRKITQRVNLFEKVLIPRTAANIKRIQIYLSDAERAAVVNSKLAKTRHAAVPA